MKLLNMFLLFFLFAMTYADEINDDGLDTKREANDMSYETRLSAESVISDEELELVYKDVEKTFVDAGHHEAAESLRAEWAEVSASISRRRLEEEQVGLPRTFRNSLNSLDSMKTQRISSKSWQIDGGITGWCRNEKGERFGQCIEVFSLATTRLNNIDTFLKAQGADVCFQKDSSTNEGNKGKCSDINMFPCDTSAWDLWKHDDACVSKDKQGQCASLNWSKILVWGQMFINIISMIFTGGASAAGKVATMTLAKNAAQNTMLRQFGAKAWASGIGKKLMQVSPNSLRANCMASIKLATKHASKSKEWFNFKSNLKSHIFEGGMSKALKEKLGEEMIWMLTIGEPSVLKSIVTAGETDEQIVKAAWELGAVVDPTGITAVLKYYKDRGDSACEFEKPPVLSQDIIKRLEEFGGAIDHYEGFTENSKCFTTARGKTTNTFKGYIYEDLGRRFASPQACAESKAIAVGCASRIFQHNAETQSCECCADPRVKNDPTKKWNTYELTVENVISTEAMYITISTGGKSVEFTVAVVGDATPDLLVNSGKFLGTWDVIKEGALQFSDRNYVLQDVPGHLIGAKYFKGPCQSNGASVSIKTSGTLYLLASHGNPKSEVNGFVLDPKPMSKRSIEMRTTSFGSAKKFEEWNWTPNSGSSHGGTSPRATYVCPAGYLLAFPGSPKGECQQDSANGGESGVSANSREECAKKCTDKGDKCYAFDYNFDTTSCYLNTHCDKQDNDEFLSCRKNKCPEGWEPTFGRSEDGECNHSGGTETSGGEGLTMEQCAAKCANDVTCVAFDIHTDGTGKCRLNTKCSKQDKGDGYLSCTRKRPQYCPSGYERRSGYSTKIIGHENAHDALKRKVDQDSTCRERNCKDKPQLDADSLRIVGFEDLPTVTALNIDDCAKKCRLKGVRCKAFEYSESSRYCYLLSDPEPESSTQELDFMFCAKPMTVEQRLSLLDYKYIGNGLCKNERGGDLYAYYSDKLSMSECINFCEEETYCMGIAITNKDDSNPNRCYMYGEKKAFHSSRFYRRHTETWERSWGEGVLMKSAGSKNARCYVHPDYINAKNEPCKVYRGQRFAYYDYGNHRRTWEASAEACRDRCTKIHDCKGSSWWSNGGCHLSSSHEMKSDSYVTSYKCQTGQDKYTKSVKWKPRDNDQCVKSSGSHWKNYDCSSDSGYCYTYPKVMLRCCPETCGSGVFTQVMCENTNGDGICRYPNAAQDALQDLGSSGCSPEKPCGACQGDCDKDADCQYGLKCFQRDSSSEQVPNCYTGGAGNVGNHDYCYDPSALREKKLTFPDGTVIARLRKRGNYNGKLPYVWEKFRAGQRCADPPATTKGTYGRKRIELGMFKDVKDCAKACYEKSYCQTFSWNNDDETCTSEGLVGIHECLDWDWKTHTDFYQLYEGCGDMLPIYRHTETYDRYPWYTGYNNHKCNDGGHYGQYCCDKGYEVNDEGMCVATENCGATCTLTLHGRDMEFGGAEKWMKELKTVDACADACMKDSKCFAIDFGKKDRLNRCYHVTVNTLLTEHNKNYDCWKKTCHYPNGNPGYFTSSASAESVISNQVQFSAFRSFLAIIVVGFTISFLYRSCKKSSGYVDVPSPSETEI